MRNQGIEVSINVNPDTTMTSQVVRVAPFRLYERIGISLDVQTLASTNYSHIIFTFNSVDDVDEFQKKLDDVKMLIQEVKNYERHHNQSVQASSFILKGAEQ